MHFSDNSLSGIGTSLGRYRQRVFGIRLTDRFLHMYVIGQTGTGKTTLLFNMIKQDIARGQGFCLIDPHGDLAEQVSAIAGPDQIYWNVADPDCPYGYNPLPYVSAEYRPLIASGLIDTLKQQWSDAWGARMEHLLRFAILALLESPNSNIRGIMPMFLNKEFRLAKLSKIKDPHVKEFWTKEFPSMNYKGAADGVAPIANKLGGFLSHPLVRKAICEPEIPLKFRKLMDEGKFLIVNLSKGKLGSDISNILGGLIVSSIGHAAYSRQNIPETDRKPYFLYADEFHSFTSSAFAGILSELRKYRLGLILAHQHTGQVKKAILEAILGNVGTVISFRIGAFDTPLIAKQFGEFSGINLLNLPNYEMFIKLMIDGTQSKVFSATTTILESKPVISENT
ncbi:MAG: type IV secretory system conjugative DNA transfer family protein [Rhizobiales bacterium]|nr:type IV secretion system DNA-binding domain-containing protein [Hyphomicrobiales bacterium]NRB15093.1 type IV secretory system conjugative DNA transfer family protein [Hyphomicrobiales bacterium]